MKLLAVEDDKDIQEIISASLKPEFQVSVVGNITDARHQLSNSKFDVIVLDVGLPDGDGLDFCKTLRTDKRFASIPVVMLSSKVAVQDRVSGLNVGALDYVAKPFDPIDFKARIQVSCARGPLAHKVEATNIFQAGPLWIDLSLQRATAKNGNKEVDLLLTPIEFRLLCSLVREKGRVFGRAELKELVWGPSVHVADRTVDKNICALRKKVEPYSDGIVTKPEEGYVFRPTSS